MIFYWGFKREKEKKVWPICKFLVDFLENLRHWPSGGRKWANEGGKKVESPLHYDGKMDLLGGCKEVGQEDVNNNTSAGQTRGANLTILDKHFFFFIFVFHILKINTGNFDQKRKKKTTKQQQLYESLCIIAGPCPVSQWDCKHHGQSAGCVYYHNGGRPFKTSVAMIWSQDISFNSFVASLLVKGRCEYVVIWKRVMWTRGYTCKYVFRWRHQDAKRLSCVSWYCSSYHANERWWNASGNNGGKDVSLLFTIWFDVEFYARVSPVEKKTKPPIQNK